MVQVFLQVWFTQFNRSAWCSVGDVVTSEINNHRRIQLGLGLVCVLQRYKDRNDEIRSFKVAWEDLVEKWQMPADHCHLANSWPILAWTTNSWKGCFRCLIFFFFFQLYLKESCMLQVALEGELSSTCSARFLLSVSFGMIKMSWSDRNSNLNYRFPDIKKEEGQIFLRPDHFEYSSEWHVDGVVIEFLHRNTSIISLSTRLLVMNYRQTLIFSNFCRLVGKSVPLDFNSRHKETHSFKCPNVLYQQMSCIIARSA